MAFLQTFLFPLKVLNSIIFIITKFDKHVLITTYHYSTAKVWVISGPKTGYIIKEWHSIS